MIKIIFFLQKELFYQVPLISVLSMKSNLNILMSYNKSPHVTKSALECFDTSKIWIPIEMSTEIVL